MIIDSHEHLMYPIEDQISKMNEAGIDKTILFGTAPHPEHAVTFADLKSEMNALYQILSGSGSKESNMQRMKKIYRKYVRQYRHIRTDFMGSVQYRLIYLWKILLPG